MKEFIYKTEQLLPINIHTVWEFFSCPHNLALLTPKEMDFKVLTKLDNQIYNDMIIDYTVKPLLHVPLHWRTKILNVRQHIEFTDIQLKGPFSLWKHVHEFIPQGEDILIKDTVYYRLPYGLIGRIAHYLFVKKRIEAIFSYRKKVLEKLFIKKSNDTI